MFVFTRRAMQQMLDAIASWMPEKPLTELVGRLNSPRTNRLPQMWIGLGGRGRARTSPS
jgi:hypothetical protein